jgi:hypothetical protein
MGNVFTCHRLIQKTREFEKANSKTFFHKLIQQVIGEGFGNLWQPIINRIYETSKTILCNYRQLNLSATII